MRSLFLAVACAASLPAWAVDPSLTASFTPDTVAPGGVSVLRLDLYADTPQMSTAFTATLPAGVTFATPATTDCDGFVTTQGATLAMTQGRVGSPCSVEVGVTSTTPGPHVLTTGPLTSASGSWGGSSATLTVDGAVAALSAAFDPPVLPVGETTTLVFTLDATGVVGNAVDATFSQILPGNLRVAPNPRAWTDCANAEWLALGTGIEFEGDIPSGTTCTARVDVVAETAGLNTVTSTPLEYGSFTGGAASADVEFTWLPVHLVVLDDPVVPGGTARLAVDVTNIERDALATDIAFTLDLGAALPGLVAASLPADPCGPGSSLTGSGVLALSGGILDSAEICHFEVDLVVPAAAPTGVHVLAAGPAAFVVDGLGRTWPAASTRLEVEAVPTVSLAASPDPVGPGELVTVDFTVTNSSTSQTLTELAFDHVLPFGLPPETIAGSCTTRGTATVLPGATDLDPRVRFSAIALGPGEACVWSLDYAVPEHTASGAWPVVTGPLSGLLAGDPVFGTAGFGEVHVVSAPGLQMSYSGVRLDPGDTAALTFVLLYDDEAGSAATDVGFTLDLDAALPGLSVVGLLPQEPCGVGSTVFGISQLTLAGASLPGGQSCAFTVTVEVPAATPSGIYTATTSPVGATVEGQATTAGPATLDFLVGGVAVDAAFTPSIAAPGDTVDLTYTLTNTDAFDTATDLLFADEIASTFVGAMITAVTPSACGTTLVNTGSGVSLSGGTLAPLASCTFTATFALPISTPEEHVGHAIAPVTASYLGVPFSTFGTAVSIEVYQPAAWTVDVISEATHAGETATLAVRIQNRDRARTLTGVSFLLDLGSAQPGLVAASLPTAPCGAGSSLTGSSVATFAGGTLPPETVCTFVFDVRIPTGATQPGHIALLTSPLTGVLGADPVLLAPRALDLLLLEPCRIGFEADGPACVDLDECATNTDTCAADASCTNRPGTYECTCNAGFQGDGETCVDIDECLTSVCDPNARCVNEPGGYECTCNAGYEGTGVTCAPVCGDGLVVSGEGCDDGDTDPGDGCDGACVLEAGWFCDFQPSICGTVCGDGVIIAGLEDCDDGNQDQDDGCDAACQLEVGWDCTDTAPTVCEAVCGDGYVRADEECDDLGLADGDGCDGGCLVEDGYACAGEPSVCELTCSNGVIDPMESCDDGGLADGDGCDGTCQIEPGWVCLGEPSVCNETCGNDAIDPGEACDDGNLEPGDGCDANCASEDGWDCDADGCDPICGDGLMRGDEECDDGNTAPGDGCDAACQEEVPCEGDACDTDDTGGRRGTGCSCDVSPGAAGGAVPVLLGLLILGWRRRVAAG